MFNAKIGLVMEAKINIAEILKDKPQGTKLYSSACGKCTLEEADDKSFKISFYNSKFGFMNGGEGHLDKNGKLYDEGECVVFPSKEMRDWRKFAWKKGDVLVSNDSDSHIIFKGFSKDDYTTFEGKHWISVSKKRHISRLDTQNTQNYHIEDNKEVAQTYINTIEERLGGKLNLETLEIEKQPEFKDGDIVLYGKSVAICRRIYKHTLYFYVSINEMFGLLFNDNCVSAEGYRFATDSEKQQLFEALAKEGKAWDAEKKQIIDLKTKVEELKPFDKVLVKDNPYGSWEPALFWKKVDVKDLHPYMIIGGKRYRYCEPYEDNEHLLGTKDNVEG